MKSFVSGIVFLFFSAFIVASCIDAPSFDDVPAISNPQVFLTSNPVSGAPGATDTVQLVFDFSDGDGDIGYDQDDSTNIPPPHVFLTFQEFDSTFNQYTIPYVPSNGGVPDITGTVTITILAQTGTFLGSCLSNPQVNTASYSIYIKDRAGNSSNVISFDPINIDCD